MYHHFMNNLPCNFYEISSLLKGRGFLRDEYYQTWADYFIRFLDEYRLQGVELWGLTAQNEPNDGRVPGFFFNSMGWTAAQQVRRIYQKHFIL